MASHLVYLDIVLMRRDLGRVYPSLETIWSHLLDSAQRFQMLKMEHPKMQDDLVSARLRALSTMTLLGGRRWKATVHRYLQCKALDKVNIVDLFIILCMLTVLPVLHRLRRGSDPTASSNVVSGDYVIKQEGHFNAGSRSPSHSRSRAASPLRILQQWSQGIHHRTHTSHHEEPFIPVDPFQSQFLLPPRLGIPRIHLPMWIRKQLRSHTIDPEGFPMKTESHSHHTEAAHYSADLHTRREDNAFAAHVHQSNHVHSMDLHMIRIFFLDTLPRLIYLHLLLRIPSMYFSRVARIFEDAEVSKPDIKRMIDACGRGGSHFQHSQTNATVTAPNIDTGINMKMPLPNNTLSTTAGADLRSTSAPNLAAAASVVDLPLPLPEEWSLPLVSSSLIRFKLSWEAFIDSLMREWKTLNVVSALLLSYEILFFDEIHD